MAFLINLSTAISIALAVNQSAGCMYCLIGHIGTLTDRFVSNLKQL